MRVLVDTSVWIDYFKTGDNSTNIDYLIDNNLVFTNEIILTELIPSLRLMNQGSIIQAIQQVAKFPLSIGWQDIQDYQYNCLKAGINGVGIPDLIILQNAIQNGCQVYTMDKHFRLIQEFLGIALYE